MQSHYLEDVKKQERAQMETEARKTKDPMKKKKLETCLQKMASILPIYIVMGLLYNNEEVDCQNTNYICVITRATRRRRRG